MPKQDRGAPARPPWLPEEDEQRGFLRSLRRKKRNADEDEPNEESLTHETERPSTPKAPAQKPIAEAVAAPVEERTAVRSGEEKANGAKPMPDASKYYTPPRKPESAEEQPPTDQANTVVQAPVSEPVAEAPRIVTGPLSEIKPESRPIPQVEQLSSSAPAESPATPEPEPVAPAATPAVEAAQQPPVEPPPPVETPAPPEAASWPAPTPEQAVAEPGNQDPFSRFSLLEAQLRQMSLDESITDDELERHRRHTMPESGPVAEAHTPLSFTPPEASGIAPGPADEAPEVTHAADEAQSAEPVPTSTLGFTLPEATNDPPEAAEEAVAEPAEPEPVVAAAQDDESESFSAETEPDTGLTEDFVPQEPEPTEPEPIEPEPTEPEPNAEVAGEFVPQSPVVEQPAPPEVAHTQADAPLAEPDDVDARAAALLQRIEAKRAELNEELAAHDAAEAEASQAEASQSEPEPAPFVPMMAPWASVPEVVDSPEPTPTESADEAETESAAVADPELEGFAPLVDEEIVISAPAVYEETSAVDALEDVVSEGEIASAPETLAAQTIDPEPVEEIADAAHEQPAEAPVAEVPEQSEPEPVAAPEPAAAPEPQSVEPSPLGAPPSWEIPSTPQAPPAAESPAQPAYFVPPTAPPQQPDPQPSVQQQPAAQAPPGWNPRQPYPGQWPQGAPQAPQPYGGQHLSSQPPPQPTSVEGQWQWVPQPPQEPQPPVQQEPPTGYAQPPQGATPPANYRAPQAYRMPPSLDEAEVVNRGRYAPRSGWRKAVHRSTGGRVNPGDSRRDREQDQLLASIRQPILGDYRIAVLSIKGGVGKTTTTLGLGSAFATIRTDRIIAVDANPDRGTLAERVRDHSTQSTVRDLLNDRNIRSYADVRNHTRMATSRLEVLASEQDPAVSEAFGEIDYRNTIDILQRYYNIILTDCGTGIMHSAMAGVLDLAHTIVLVSSPAMDSARSASATLDWLMQHGHAALVREAHVVLSASRPGSAGIKLDKVYEHFQARCRSIHMIPFDPHLAEGADVDFNLLNADTNAAYLKLAGAISESFPRLRMRGDEQR